MSLIQEVELAQQQAQRKHEINKKIEFEKQQSEQEHDSKQLKILLDTAFETHKNEIVNCAKQGKNDYYFSIPVSDDYFKNPSNIENEAKLYCLALGFKKAEVRYNALAKSPDLLALSRISFVLGSLFWIGLPVFLYVKTDYLFFLLCAIFVAFLVFLVFYCEFFPSVGITIYF